MTLAATETLDGGRVHDAQNRTSVTAGTGALPAGAYWSGGFVRDADGRLLVLVETLGAAQSAGCYFSGGFLRGPLGRLVVAQASGALSASERLSGGEVRDTAGRLVLAAGTLGAAAGATDFQSAGLRDAVGRRYAAGLSIVLAPPVNTVAPAVTPGAISTGGTLTTTNGTWTGNPTPTFTYQWQKAGANISAATSSTYVVVAGDVGSAITCNVTGTNSQGNATAASNGVTPTAGGFAPTDIAGLSAWYKADAGTSTTTDGVGVATWTDQSSGAHNAVQATGANQPLYKTAVQNSKPGLLFDGSNDLLDATGVVISQPDTIFVVAKSAVTDANGHNMIDGITTRQVVFGNSTSPFKWDMYGGTELVSTTAADTSSAHVLSAIFNGASSGLWLDGTALVAGNAGSNQLNGLRIGSFDGGSAGSWSGHIFEVLIYNTALSTTDRQSVESYLKAKWGTP